MNLLFYVIKILACSGIFYMYYMIFLRNKSFHQYNRYYILLTTGISLILPVVNIPLVFTSTTPLANTLHALSTIGWEKEFVVSSNPSSSRISLDWVFYLLYSAGIIIALIPLLNSLRLIRKCRGNSEPGLVQNIRFYITDEPESPFSFFNSIFWNRQLAVESVEGQNILRHELFHVRQKHSYDLVFMQLVKSVFWFNPFHYLFKAELQAIHEFLADEYAAADTDKLAYAEIILSKAIADKHNNLSTHFFNHQIKRRIAMITDNQRTRYGYIGRIMILPLAFIIFCAFSLSVDRKAPIVSIISSYSADTVRLADLMKMDFSTITGFSINTEVAVLNFKDSKSVSVKRSTFEEYLRLQSSETKEQDPKSLEKIYETKTFTKLEIEASYPGGADAWMKYLSSHVRYPKEAVEKNIQGTVVVQFIVDREGNLIDLQAVSGPQKGGLREEAVSVVKNSGKWLPGMHNGRKVRSYKKQPIVFKLTK